MKADPHNRLSHSPLGLGQGGDLGAEQTPPLTDQAVSIYQNEKIIIILLPFREDTLLY